MSANTREAEKTGDAIQILQDATREAEKTEDAIQILQDACRKLQKARSLIQVPCAKGAALALENIMEVTARCDDASDALGAVKAAERTTRDLVVLRCLASFGGATGFVPDDPWDRHAMLDAAELAFGHALSRDLKAALCLAFHKLRPPTAFLGPGPPRSRPRRAMVKAKAKAKARPGRPATA